MNMVSESFSDFIKSINVGDAGSEILDEISRNKESVMVDFKISNGKMSSIGEFNTWIRFDVKNCKTLKKVLDKLVSSEDPSQDDISNFDEWRKSVAENVTKEKFNDLKKHVCNSAFSGNQDMPFNVLSSDFELTDIPTNDKVIVVKKNTPQGVVIPPVSSEIMRIYEETGEDFSSIVNRKKAEGDPKYRWIVGIDAVKKFYEVTFSMAVDYSLQEKQGKVQSSQ